MNRLLERAVAPTIWITNDVEQLGAPIIRRMNLALRFPKPGLSVRQTMIARVAATAEFRLDPAVALDLAQSPAPPALIENAIRSAKSIEGSAQDAGVILATSLRALGRRGTARSLAPIAFDPALSSADVDLARLADQVAGSPERALSFCLSGPPGAGKSAYARHLAERLECDVLEKRYSDLVSMWLTKLALLCLAPRLAPPGEKLLPRHPVLPSDSRHNSVWFQRCLDGARLLVVRPAPPVAATHDHFHPTNRVACGSSLRSSLDTSRSPMRGADSLITARQRRWDRNSAYF